MALMSAGMATMYLNERLSFGMAPDDITGVFTQLLRWWVVGGREGQRGGGAGSAALAAALQAVPLGAKRGRKPSGPHRASRRRAAGPWGRSRS